MGERAAAAARVLRADRPRALAALLLAGAMLVLVALGLALPTNGGVLRYSPYATLVLGPLTVIALVVRPWVGLCLWMLLMPLMNLAQVQVFIGPEQVILTSVFLIALLVGAVFDWRRAPGRMLADRPTRVAWLLIAVAATLALISTALSPNLVRALPISQHGLLEPLAILALALWFRPTWPQLAGLTTAMGVSVALGALLSFTRMVVRLAQSLAQFEAERSQLSRMVYFNVGILGNMLAMALPLLIAWLILRREGPRPRLSGLIAGVAVSVSLILVYLTFSKSGWLGAIASCAGLLVLIAHQWRTRLAVAVVALALTSLVLPYPAFLLRAVSPTAATAYTNVVGSINSRADTIDPSTPEGEVSVTERVLATEAGIRMAIDHPLLGVGPGSFAAEYASTYRAASSTRALDSAHDLLPYVSAEFGLIVGALVGLGLASGLLGAALAYARAPAGDRRIRVAAAAVGAALLGFVVVSTTFGVDLYRPYRTMNSDVLFAALLVAAGIMLPRLAREGWPAPRGRPARDSGPLDQRA